MRGGESESKVKRRQEREGELDGEKVRGVGWGEFFCQTVVPLLVQMDLCV